MFSFNGASGTLKKKNLLFDIFRNDKIPVINTQSCCVESQIVETFCFSGTRTLKKNVLFKVLFTR